ncbi:MAG: hypothetical protein U5Q16_14410 [Gammaproteobacteria bacterium]|nr:hypothetical protein [Gammaproteobacteria bacterium]
MIRTATAAILLLIAGIAQADAFSEAADRFRDAGASARFFDDSYGYAIFPGSPRPGSSSAEHAVPAAFMSTAGRWVNPP